MVDACAALPSQAIPRARIFNALFALGFFVTLFLAAFFFSVVNAMALAAYILVFLFRMFRRFRHRSVAVKYADTGGPLPFALVRFHSSATCRLVKSTVADERGRIYVLVPPGNYFLTVEEKQPDGSYRLVHRSRLMRLKKGCWRGMFWYPRGTLRATKLNPLDP